MNPQSFTHAIEQSFQFELTPEQKNAINCLVNFQFSNDQKSLFILRGFAGTGKTTLMSCYVKALKKQLEKFVLLAPTGRAAKVFSNTSGYKATTVHKKIYQKEQLSSGIISLSLAQNLHQKTTFIIDEASMIGNMNSLTNAKDLFESRNLLEDIFNYVYTGFQCKLVFIGDEAQLPPIGIEKSTAIDADYLKKKYGFNIFTLQLVTVLRQNLQSGVLFNATSLRQKIGEPFNFKFQIEPFTDIRRINGNELQEELEDCYHRYGSEDTILITRSNKRANLYNQEIRNRIFWFEEQISKNDLIMVVRNNYYWLDEKSEAGFIANGEIIRVNKICRIETKYDFLFAEIDCELIDYPNMGNMQLLINLETINSVGPSLPRESMKKLFHAIEQEYIIELNKKKRYQKVLNNPYFNALQVKFSYAMTCHKTQGGQWSCVFIDQGYLLPNELDTNYLRWLYTALTRATKKVYLLNFNNDFFVN